MLKKLLLIAAVFAFAMPVLAQTGKWTFEVGAWDAQPRGQELTYAFPAGTGTASASYQMAIGPAYQTSLGRKTVPTFKIAYASGDWTTWMSYSHFSQSQSGDTAASSLIAPSIFNAWWGIGGVKSGWYSNAMKQDLYDLNVGRTFHPTNEWDLMLYTGLKSMKLDGTNNVVYVNDDVSTYYGPNATFNTILTNSAKGFGLNFGLVSTFNADRTWSFSGGAELSLLSVKNDIMRNERFIDTLYMGTFLADNPSASLHYVTQGAKLFLETKVNFSKSWYAKIGYRFDHYQGLIRYYRAIGYAAGGFIAEPQDLTMQGFYLSTGFTW